MQQAMPGPDLSNSKPFFKEPKIMRIAAAVAVLLTILVIIAVKVLTSQLNGQDAVTKIYDRPGYDRSSLPLQISDPFAVAFKPASQPVLYNGAAVIQACNLLPLSDLVAEEVKIGSDPYQSTISRTIYDGKGGTGFAELPKAPVTTLAVSGQRHMTGCTFAPKDAGALSDITITAFQPAVLSEENVMHSLNTLYERQGALEGFDLYARRPTSIADSDDETIAYKSGVGGFGLRISKSISETDGQANLMQKLLPKIAQHFIKEQAATSGVSLIDFDSPLFAKSTFSACDVLLGDDIRSFTGQQAAPLADQTVGPYIANAMTEQLPSMDFYTANSCTRKTVSQSLLDEMELKLTIHTFLKEDTAKYWAENTAANDAQWRKLPELNGGLLFGGDTANLYFSKGRAKFMLTAGTTVNRNTPVRSSEEAERMLIPIAKTIMTRQEYK